ncbi:MAG: tail fiber protein [Steroidobacteraceae bacterium]
MSDPYVGEIRAMGFNFSPQGWAMCNGQLLPISQNTALFSLIGTFYGGNGTSNFALPNLQGMVAVGAGQGVGLSPYEVGQTGGEAAHTLTTAEMAAHDHTIGVSSAAATSTTASSATAVGMAASNAFGPVYNMTAMGGAIGGGASHDNEQPYLVVNFCIALQGIFPPRS